MPDNAMQPSAPNLQAALDWLSKPADSNAQAELVALCAHLAEATAAAVPPLQWHTIIELFHSRSNGVGNALKPLLLEASLPLSRRLRMIAQGLIEAHGALAAGYLRVLREGEPDKLKRPQRNRALLCARAIAHLAEQQEISLLVAASPPPSLWQQTLAVLGLLKDDFPPEATLPPDIVAADRVLKRMLALAASQPETCAVRELAFIADYLRSFAGAVEVRFSPPPDLGEWYWLDANGDAAPMAAARRPPPAEAPCLFFSCRQLGEQARDHLARLAKERPEAIGLPPLAAAEDYRNALARTAARWAAPPTRHHHRRRTSYRVQVCTHLGTLWQLLAGRADGGNGAEGLPITDWMVLNESAGGFAMMHIAGDTEGIVSGAALGMRTGDEPWRLCIVRWARSENAEHVELGLELVAPTAQAVQIVYPSDDGRLKPRQALLLPSLPRLERGETLMTARGNYAGGTFTLITEADGKLKLTECISRDLAMQTAAVDVFEFMRDFSPL